MNDRRDAQGRFPTQDSDGRERIPSVPISGLAIPKLGRDEPLAQVEPCEQTSRPEFIFPRGMHECRILDAVWHHACLIDFRRPIKSRQF